MRQEDGGLRRQLGGGRGGACEYRVLKRRIYSSLRVREDDSVCK